MKIFKRRELSPTEQKIKKLRKEQQNLQADVVFGQAKPGDPAWEKASARSKEIAKEIRKLEKGR